MKVVHQANQGTWTARNVALQHARGEYLTWVDNDDMVFPQFLEFLYGLMQRFGTDIAMCRFEDSPRADLPAQPKPEVEPECVMDFEAYAVALQGIRETEMIALWNKLYRRKLWEGIQFVTGSFVDDGYVVWKVVYKAGEMAVSTRSLYLYYDSPLTVSRNDSYRIRGARNADCLAERYQFFRSHGYTWPAGMTLRRCYENIARFYLGLTGGTPIERQTRKELRRVFFRLLPRALASSFFGRRAKLYLLGAVFTPQRCLPHLQQQMEWRAGALPPA